MGFFEKFNTQSKQIITNLELEINELKKTISAYEQELVQKSSEIHNLKLELEIQNNNLLTKTNSIRQLFYEKEQLNAAISEKNAFIRTQTVHLQAVETVHMECLKKTNDLEL